jgi:hypothetical protein
VTRVLLAALGVLISLSSSVSANAARVAATPGAHPRILNVVRVRLKPKSSAAYAALESQIVKAYERAKVRMYWICFQSPKDSTDIVYLNLYDSADEPARAAATYREAIEQHPDLQPFQQRLSALTASTTSTLTTRRDDIDRAVSGVDFAAVRSLRLTTFEVRAGREGEFVKAIRTANPKDGAWLVYEANDSPTFMLMTLKASSINRRDGPAIPRTLRSFRGADFKTDSRVYSVRPSMSHVSRAFVTAHPQLWKPAPATATTH